MLGLALMIIGTVAWAWKGYIELGLIICAWRRRVEIKNTENKTVCAINHKKVDAIPFNIGLAGGQYSVEDENIENFIKDSEAMFKYVR
jgi:phosphoribosylformylglycinamidine (FGAM) synthase-like amidotransferase family enzyme